MGRELRSGRHDGLVGLLVSHNGEDYGCHFPGHMATNDIHVAHALRGFLFVVRLEHGIMLDRYDTGPPNGLAQIWGTALGHMDAAQFRLSGLLYSGVHTGVGGQFVRGREYGDVSDLTEDRRTQDRIHTRDRGESGLESREMLQNMTLQSGGSVYQMLHLLQVHQNQSRINAL